ncbi:MAG: ferritin family protein [Desulfocapsaceae bacterium]|jgi:rubrerythrin|nr:ferritin family protein [Desulfocapsaceae bacterium]
MESITIFITALEYEKKIRDLYVTAVSIIDDDRGKAIFQTLADEEQSHVDFLEHSIETLKSNGNIAHEQLRTAIPDTDSIQKNIEALKIKIPERMLGDLKRVLSSALKLEIETTQHYQKAFESAEGDIKAVLGKFVEIEQRHTDVVRFELDYASHNGFWLGFPEISMEVG